MREKGWRTTSTRVLYIYILLYMIVGDRTTREDKGNVGMQGRGLRTIMKDMGKHKIEEEGYMDRYDRYV